MPRSREILLPRDSQPQEAAELAGSNFSWVGTSLQAVDGSALAQAGNVFTRGATPAGVGYNITTAASGALTHAVPTRSGAQPFTIVHQIYSAGRAFDWHTIFVVGTRFVEVREESGGKLQVYVNGAYQIETSSSIFGTPGTYTIGITYDGATASLVLNGVLIGTYASTNLGSATSTPYKIGDDYWQYAKVCTHTFAHYLTEARSVPWLVDATRNPWQLFAPQAIPVPVSAGGGGTTISATPGNAVADGTTASVKRTIPATPGNASASGTTASVVRVIGAAPGNAVADGTTAAVTRSIAATPGNAVADGVTATVTNSGTTTISCTPGNAAADGALAAITRSIAAAPGNAVANGAIAALLRVIATTPGNAVADGVTAAVQGSITISCTPGNAVADGVAATVTNGDAQGAGMGFSMSRMRRLVKIQFNGKLYQAFEEDIPELLETLEEQAEQKIKKKRNARAKPAPVATVVSAPADVLPSLQSRIAEVNHSIGVLWGVDEDEDEELLWLML